VPTPISIQAADSRDAGESLFKAHGDWPIAPHVPITR
jgi:hypothetical protein